MIGAAVLVTGLLLILAGLAAARIPGGAAFAPAGTSAVLGGPESGPSESGPSGPFAFARRARNPVRAFALSPIHPATWYANAGIGLGFLVGVLAFAAIASLFSAGLTTLAAGVGLVFIALGIEGSRLVARIERWRLFVGEPERPTGHAYKPVRPFRGRFLAVLRSEYADESRWRDVLYVAVNFPLAVIEFIVAAAFWGSAVWLLSMPIWYDLVGAPRLEALGPVAGHEPGTVLLRILVGAALLPVAASLSQLLTGLHRGVVTSLLCSSESRELRRQVETLRKSRSEVLDVEASELHRIERDLHDGAQQRLVMLTIDLGLASERVDEDPAAAKQLILDGQVQAREALAEIRQLVRGIAPSILLDRGLVSALESLSGHGPVPIAIRSDLEPGERLPAGVERAAYFVATEALANVAKHSGASRCEVRCRREGDQLVVEVWDDGTGGARTEPGGGLAGLERRVAGVDGTFSVTSPAGGPTLIRAEIPIPAAAYEPR